MRSSKLSEFGLLGFACLTLAACAEGKSDQTPQVSVPQISALENPVAKCQEDQAACVQAATDGSAALQCGDSYRKCLGSAAEEGQQLAQTLEQCRATASQCAVQNGATGADACRSDYESCVSAATGDGGAPPTAGTGAGGEGGSVGPSLPQRPEFPQLPAAGTGVPSFPTPGGPGLPGRLPFAGAGGLGGLPSLPGRPGFPTAGGIALPGRPDPAASAACFEALRMCSQAPNADLDQCATTARACLRGGGTQGSGGAGGSDSQP